MAQLRGGAAGDGRASTAATRTAHDEIRAWVNTQEAGFWSRLLPDGTLFLYTQPTRVDGEIGQIPLGATCVLEINLHEVARNPQAFARVFDEAVQSAREEITQETPDPFHYFWDQGDKITKTDSLVEAERLHKEGWVEVTREGYEDVLAHGWAV